MTRGRSVRWVQEAVSAGQSIAPDVVEVLVESEPRAERKSLLKLAKLPHPRQRQIAKKVGSGVASLKVALDPENATASDEGAKYARCPNKWINLLAQLKGFEGHLDHKSVAAVRRRYHHLLDVGTVDHESSFLVRRFALDRFSDWCCRPHPESAEAPRPG